MEQKPSVATGGTEMLSCGYLGVHLLKLVERKSQESVRSKMFAAAPSCPADQGRSQPEKGGLWHTHGVLVGFHV